MPLANLNLTDCSKECYSILLSLHAFAEKLLANGKVGVDRDYSRFCYTK